ncbi:hypothetical protein A0H81_05550, partial [Grifola frondosa]
MSPSPARLMTSQNTQDELTATVFGAVDSLSQERKASLLLETAVALIEAGRYGDEVENYLEVYLRTPGLPKKDIARALLARGNARKALGEKLLAKAQQDFQAVAKLDPSNRDLQAYLRRSNTIHFVDEPASQRAPPEIWERIAHFIPRYHLRAWFFRHRSPTDFPHNRLVLRRGSKNLSRGLDIFDRVKADPVSQVASKHCGYIGRTKRAICST